MQNIITYAKEETRSFKEFPFNDVDSLIFSTIVYLDLASCVPNYGIKQEVLLKSLDFSNVLMMTKNIGNVKEYQKLLLNIQKNPRFCNFKLGNYIDYLNEKKEMHFGAMTFKNDEFTYVAFMGTTASLISWKEDFNMAYLSPVPSQKFAKKYLNYILHNNKGPIYVGGHSKGGNLAIYATMHTLFWHQSRIVKIFSHDGPGFTKKDFNSYRYKLIKHKIYKTLPSSSIVGMLLFSRENYKVIKSSTFSILQHNSFSWQIKNSDFVYLNDRAWDSKYFDKTISNWLNDLNDKEKKIFINTLYNILNSVDYAKIDITKNKYLGIYKTIKAGTAKLDPETKSIIDKIFNKLIYYEKLNLLTSDK